LWQRIIEHDTISHIVDFAARSAGWAIAASGAVEYEGIAANDVHPEWLDPTLAKVPTYLPGKDQGNANELGGDAEFLDKVKKYFSGTMMEARRIMEPAEAAGEYDGSDEGAYIPAASGATYDGGAGC
jgi:hypothetical protein